MKAFMIHPTPETLAAAHPYSSRMSAEEAEEAAETAEIFAKTAERVKRTACCDWPAKITREIADFAQAVAKFKAEQEAVAAVGDRK